MSPARARRIALGALLTVIPGSRALADDPALSGETIANTGNGRGSAPCQTCHGAAGEGNATAGFPRIAGQDAGYIARQVRLTRDGERPAPAMAPVVTTLTDAEIDAVAAYYAELPVPPATAEAPEAAVGAIAAPLVAVGDWRSRNLPSCESCHGPGTRGVNAAFPGIAGQHASYLKAQLELFRSGERKTDPGNLMGTVAAQLTDEEITALSSWLAAQPSTRPEVP